MRIHQNPQTVTDAINSKP